MCKLTRVASIIVNVSKMCGRHNLSQEELPASLLAILGSLQKFVLIRLSRSVTHTV